MSPRFALCAAVLALVTLATPATARADSVFAITGRGWGHGIGMTQYGALGYAQQGETYDWILAHYFQQTALSTRPELTVNVDLDASKAARSSWRIAAASTSATLTVADYVNGAHSVEVTGGASVWITFKAGGAVLSSDRYSSATKLHSVGPAIAAFPASVVAATGPSAASEVRILGTSGPFSQSNIGWRGQIRFVPSATTGHAVNYVPMEQYLRGVVPRESPSSWGAAASNGMEALKAQAVVARSFAYCAASSGSTLWCTTQSEVYNGADDGASSHESAYTDAAVADTANQCVVYGSKVVQTFFSSSSGGHTANIEDVWLNSTPEPYYTGVASGESATSPNYRWSLADMTGTTLAGKVRSHYASLSRPSPATVTTVTLDVGSSGYVRHVALRWSKGADTVLTGTQFESALGLKSSAFSVLLKNPPPPPGTRYQDTDARPLWTGSWSIVKTSSASGGSYRRSGSKGARYTAIFQGTTVSWVGTTGNRAGKADVALDGTHMATIDLYSPATRHKVAVWSTTGLSASATHTLVVTVLGTHRRASAGSYVYVDAIGVGGSLLAVPRPPVWKRCEQNSSFVGYRGAWKTSALAGLSGGTHAYSHDTSATAAFTFAGTQVRWIGRRAANCGKAWVSVDASAPVLVDLYSAKALNQQRLFESPALPPGTHTLTVRVAGTKSAKATGDYVDVDAFEALQPVK
jgi:SpoIID/LytB domain protein